MKRGRPRKPLVATPQDIEQLRAVLLSKDVGNGLKVRSQIVLLSAEGMLNQEIAQSLNISNSAVGKWRSRFIEHGLCGLLDRPRSGRPRAVSERQVRLILNKTFRARDRQVLHSAVFVSVGDFLRPNGSFINSGLHISEGRGVTNWG